MKTDKADLSFSDIASHGQLLPQQRQARKKGRLDVYPIKKGVDRGVTRANFTGSFAAGMGQSTLGSSRDRYDPTVARKEPVPPVIDLETAPRPPPKKKDQQLVPNGPTHIGAYESDRTKKNRVVKGGLGVSPELLGKGATQSIAVDASGKPTKIKNGDRKIPYARMLDKMKPVK